jgi:HTH-type transcriptional regulator/antitoxin HigA
MAKQGWLPKPGWPVDVALHLLEFFGVASLQNVPKSLPAAFRRSSRVSVSPEALAAWLRRGELDARATELPPFDEKNLRDSLAEIRLLTLQPPEVFEHGLRDLLASAGVAFVVVPHLPKTGAHGATRWIGDKAIMQVSLRYRWADIFWFTVFHEIGHLLLHGRRDTFIEFERRRPEAAEIAADVFAANTLIPPHEYERFLASLRGRPVTIDDVLAFSRQLGIAEGIVVGRLQYDRRLLPSHLNGLRRRFGWVDVTRTVG